MISPHISLTLDQLKCLGCGEANMTNQKIEVPPKLTAQDKSSFAYKTIKDRLPVIVVKTLDFFHRKKKDLHKYGGTIKSPNETELLEIEEDAKSIITQLTRLRKMIETNKTVTLLDRLDLPPELAYFNDDLDAWNAALVADGDLPKWFESPWLLVESYLYRYIKQISLETRHLKVFDPFIEQKQAACRSSLPQMLIVANHLKQVEKVTCERTVDHTHPNERNEFGLFVQLALWANKSDLSLSGMSAAKVQSQDLLAGIKETLDDLRDNILCDNMSDLWFKVQSIKDKVRASKESDKPVYIDLVADNSGYEIFVDLCLIHYLTLVFCPVSLGSSGVRFRLHLKRMPWYVSDTMRQDIDFLLSYLREQDGPLKDLSDKWKSFFDSKFWEVYDHQFWTLPHDYSEMPTVAKDLYESLKKSSLIIFKGDLNYRKLAGDRKWHMLTPFKAALREFTPAPLVALRTAKADIVVGIEDVSIYARINNNELPRDWMISGEFGLVQYFDPS